MCAEQCCACFSYSFLYMVENDVHLPPSCVCVRWGDVSYSNVPLFVAKQGHAFSLLRLVNDAVELALD